MSESKPPLISLSQPLVEREFWDVVEVCAFLICDSEALLQADRPDIPLAQIKVVPAFSRNWRLWLFVIMPNAVKDEDVLTSWYRQIIERERATPSRGAESGGN